jgi:hypothetical protein
MGPIFSDGEWKFMTVVFVVGLFVGLPAVVIGLGYGAYRVIAAAVRGW